jgi:hypothetical protein
VIEKCPGSGEAEAEVAVPVTKEQRLSWTERSEVPALIPVEGSLGGKSYYLTPVKKLAI